MTNLGWKDRLRSDVRTFSVDGHQDLPTGGREADIHGDHRERSNSPTVVPRGFAPNADYALRSDDHGTGLR